MSTISENLSEITKEIAPYKPKIIAVTKYTDENSIVEAYNAGIRDFGENRVVDAISKIDKLPEFVRKNSRFHLIGHLQTNKVKKAVGYFYMIQSVDTLKLAQAIDEEASKKRIVQKILLQINNANEESKFGFSREIVESVFKEILSLKNVEIKGLMTIAPNSNDEVFLRELFKEIVQIKDKISKKYNYNLIEASMGMSNDYSIAVKEGSTMIRVGRKLFLNKGGGK